MRHCSFTLHGAHVCGDFWNSGCNSSGQLGICNNTNQTSFVHVDLGPRRECWQHPHGRRSGIVRFCSYRAKILLPAYSSTDLWPYVELPTLHFPCVWRQLSHDSKTRLPRLYQIYLMRDRCSAYLHLIISKKKLKKQIQRLRIACWFAASITIFVNFSEEVFQSCGFLSAIENIYLWPF